MKDFSGQVIKGYQIKERIGKGGFGEVYRAYQPSIEREVVMKVILPVFANDPYFIRSFEAEAHLIARLENIHIVPLYDYWRDPNGAYLVMRYLRGGSLLDAIKQGNWDVDAAVKLLDQLAGALTVAHRNNIVHQDIKPANILLDEDGNVYLSDFGLAKDLNLGIDLAATGKETIHGSPAYISPEQITRSKITPQTDIYSLGVVLYELLTGYHPFQETDVVKLLQHQLHTNLPPLRRYRPELTDSLDIVLWKATAKDPEMRHPSVLAMAEEFREVVVRHHREMADSDRQQPATPRVTERPPTLIISLSSIDLASTPANPYKGLHAFQEADAADFYGRESLVETLAQRLCEDVLLTRFLAVVGPSGSGKSSAVKAGLLPAIRKGRLPGSDNWYIVEMTPGAEPTVKLEEALLRVATRGDSALFRPLHDRQDGLTHTLNHILPQTDSELVLVIDQFEEVFTLVSDEANRVHFLANLHHAVTAADSRLHLIITLRADFYDRPLLYSGFGDLIRSRTEVVLPLNPDELNRAITRPAARAGLQLETGLVDMIIEDVGQQPGTLPLLQYALTELYERRDDKTLTIAGYRATGGISGALARRASAVYDELPPEYQPLAQQLFLRLVTPGEGTEDTRRRALQSEIYTITSDRQAIEQVIDSFARYRLLAFDRDPVTRTPTIEIAHEALIRRWQQLRDWLNANRDDLRTHQRLANATGEWLRASHDRSYLATGARLTQFESLSVSSTIALSADEQDYLRQSIRQRQQNTRRRQLFSAGLAAVTIFAVALALFAFDQRNQTEAARQAALAERDRADQESRISRSRELAASALNTRNQLDLPLLLSIEALKVADTYEARNSLLNTLDSQPRLYTMLHGHTDWIRSTAYSPDGHLIASTGRDLTIRLWDVQTHASAGEPFVGHQAWVNTLAFSPDNRLLASGSEDGSIMLWNVATGDSQQLGGHESAAWGLAFNFDGTLMASGDASGMITLWDVSAGEIIATYNDHEGTVYSLAFHGDTLASASADRTIRLWDVSNPQNAHSRILTGHTNWVLALAFHPAGDRLASGGADNTIRLWDINTNSSTILQGHTDWVRSLTFDHDGGNVLISAGADSRILLWDLANQRIYDRITNVRQSPVWSIALSPDDRQLVSGGTANTLHLWRINPDPTHVTVQHPLATSLVTEPQEQVLSVAFAPDNSLMASAGGQNTNFAISVWNTTTLRTSLNGHSASVTALVFNPDPASHQIASASLDRSVRVWNISTGETMFSLPFDDALFSLAYSPDGRLLAAGDNDGSITLWDVNSGEMVDEIINAHTDRILSLAFSPDSALLASASQDSTIQLWDTTTWQPNGALNAHTGGVFSLAFSPDGKLLASGSRDSSIILWDVTTGQPADSPLTAHTDWVMALTFSPNGEFLASSGSDRTIILWDTALRRPIGPPLNAHTDWVNTIAFSPDGEFLASGGRDAQLILWSANPVQWQAAACAIANRNLTSDEAQLYFQGQDTPHTCPPTTTSE